MSKEMEDSLLLYLENRSTLFFDTIRQYRSASQVQCGCRDFHHPEIGDEDELSILKVKVGILFCCLSRSVPDHC